MKMTAGPYRYFLVYKPFGMLSQFSREGDNPVLGDLSAFPKDVYPVGRLDKDSEGLLLLTNDTRINASLLEPGREHWRKYWVQVEGEIDAVALSKLESGVSIKVGNDLYRTRPARAKQIDEPELPERNPPIRFRKSIPTSWIELQLGEGKNRQVRKMTAAVGFPTLRLVRCGIGNVAIGSMGIGEVRELGKEEVMLLFSSR
jgi:23S rRNA pseudouridine2457 synthase